MAATDSGGAKSTSSGLLGRHRPERTRKRLRGEPEAWPAERREPEQQPVAGARRVVRVDAERTAADACRRERRGGRRIRVPRQLEHEVEARAGALDGAEALA